MNIISKFKHRATVGLDIGSHSVKLTKLVHKKNGLFLEAVGIEELEQGCIVAGDIKKRDELINAIMRLVNQCDPSIVEVVISISGHGILSDKFNFRVNSEENIEEMILWEATQRSPFDVDNITIDYKILQKFPDTNEIEVLIVAAKNQIMMRYIDLLYEAGLKPVLVDTDAFAIYNCYCNERLNEPEEETVTLINIGHDLTNITFIGNGKYRSSRDISTAGEFFSKTLRRNLNISEEEADLILKGEAGSQVDPQLIQQNLEYAAEELASGIDLAFSYYRSSETSERIDKMVISGGGAYIPEIIPFLKKRYETNIQVSNPLANLHFDPMLFGNINPLEISSFLTVAVGLALRNIKE